MTTQTLEVDEDEDEIVEDESGERIYAEGDFKSGNKSYIEKEELELWADQLLKEDSNRELCRKCKEKDSDCLPYGEETGEIESVAQYDEQTNEPIVDDEGNQLYLDFPELRCEKGHRWFKGEGARRDIRGPNPILFASHLYGRKRREIMVESGIPDPSFTKDRFGRPTHGMYNRVHPQGRKVNTPDQRQANGASFYR